MMAFCNVLRAQDTVPFGQFDNYFVYGNLPEFDKCRHYYIGSMSYPGNGGESGKYFFSSDSLKIYGIAAGVREYTLCRYLVDTTYDNSIEYLRLYYPVADTLQCLNQAPVHLHHNISYYMNCDTVNPPSSDLITEMHERYFPSPTTVVDSFYVGCTFYLHKYLNGVEHEYQCHPLCISAITSVDLMNEENFILCFRKPVGVPDVWSRTRSYKFSIIFPILTPPHRVSDTTHFCDTSIVGDTIIVSDTTIVCDTIINGNDTIFNYDTIISYDTILSLPDAGLLGRLTGVMPNPAAENAKVLSSFGLSRVEAYNLAGEKVDDLQLPSPSLSATLDVRRWPVGAYILRIHTPQGVATKKLTVVR